MIYIKGSDRSFLIRGNQLNELKTTSVDSLDTYLAGHFKGSVLLKGDSFFVNNQPLNNLNYSFRNHRFANFENHALIALLGNKIYYQKNDTRSVNGFFDHENKNVLGLFFFQEKVFIATSFGVYSLPQHTISETPKMWLEKAVVNDISMDKENNTWLSTSGSGLYKIPSLSIYNLPENESIFSIASYRNEYIYTGSRNGEVKVYKIMDDAFECVYSFRCNSMIRQLSVKGERLYILTENELLVSPVKAFTLTTMYASSSMKAFTLYDSTTVFISCRTGMETVTNCKKVSEYTFQSINRIYGGRDLGLQ